MYSSSISSSTSIAISGKTLWRYYGSPLSTTKKKKIYAPSPQPPTITLAIFHSATITKNFITGHWQLLAIDCDYYKITGQTNNLLPTSTVCYNLTSLHRHSKQTDIRAINNRWTTCYKPLTVATLILRMILTAVFFPALST